MTFTEQESIRGIIGYGMGFLRDGRLVAIKYAGPERVICDVSRAESERVKVGAGEVASTILSQDMETLVLLARSEDSPRRVARWRVSDDTLTELEPFEACFDIGCLEVSSKSVWAIGERQGSRICLYEALHGLPGKQIALLETRARDPRTMAFSPDGSRLLVGFNDGGIAVCEQVAEHSPSWEIRRQWRGERGPIRAGAFHPVDAVHLVTGSEHGYVTIWNLDQEVPADDVLQRSPPISGGILISPDGSRLFAYPFNSECLCWDWTSKQRMFHPGHQGLMGNGAYLPDNVTIVSQSDSSRTLSLFDSDVWHTRCCLEGGRSIFTSFSISPDGKAIAAGDRDGTVQLFRRANDNEVEAAGW